MATAQKVKASGKGKAVHSLKPSVRKGASTTKVKTPAPAKPVTAKKVGAGVAKKTSVAKAKAALKKEKVEAQQVEATPVVAPVSAAKAKTRKINIDASVGESLTQLAAKWAQLQKKIEQIETKAYNMKAAFEEKTGITHKTLGWGYILANRNDRLEVLFKDGIKYLISNYKP